MGFIHHETICYQRGIYRYVHICALRITLGWKGAKEPSNTPPGLSPLDSPFAAAPVCSASTLPAVPHGDVFWWCGSFSPQTCGLVRCLSREKESGVGWTSGFRMERGLEEQAQKQCSIEKMVVRVMEDGCKACWNHLDRGRKENFSHCQKSTKESFPSQRGYGPDAWASLGSCLHLQNLRPHSTLLNQNQHYLKAPQGSCMHFSKGHLTPISPMLEQNQKILEDQ